MITKKNVQISRQESPELWGWHTQENSKNFFHGDTVNTRWLKNQEFVSNVDHTISTEMNECCSVPIYVVYHIRTPAAAGHCMYEVDVQESPWIRILYAFPQSHYSQKILPNLNNEFKTFTMKGQQP